jgi:hypothetical protein
MKSMDTVLEAFRHHGKYLLQKFLPIDLAVNIGTKTTRIYRLGRGIVCEMPSQLFVISRDGKSFLTSIGGGQTNQRGELVKLFVNGAVANPHVLAQFVKYAITAAIIDRWRTYSGLDGFDIVGSNWTRLKCLRLRRVLIASKAVWTEQDIQIMRSVAIECGAVSWEIAVNREVDPQI